MIVIAERTEIYRLVELTEEEVAEPGDSPLAGDVTRPEGADGRPRLWVDEEEFEDLKEMLEVEP